MRKLLLLGIAALSGFILAACGGTTKHNPTFGGATQPPPQTTTGTKAPTTTGSGY